MILPAAKKQFIPLAGARHNAVHAPITVFDEREKERKRERRARTVHERFSAATASRCCSKKNTCTGRRGEGEGGGREAPLVTHLCDHLSPGLISFTVIGFFLQLLYHPLPGGSVLERELGHDPAEFVRLRVLHPVQRYTQPEDEFVESIYDPPVHDAQHDYPLGAVRQEVGHSASTKEHPQVVD